MLGSRADPALRTALAGKPSAELRERAERLLSALDPSAPLAGDDLRDVRAVQALELIATPAARRQIERLADGERHAVLTREATSAVARLGSR